eukprot:gene12272-biopygen6647
MALAMDMLPRSCFATAIDAQKFGNDVPTAQTVTPTTQPDADHTT